MSKIFPGADGDCPTLERKRLICAKGGDAGELFCEAHPACGNGTVLETLTIANRKDAKKSGRVPENERGERPEQRGAIRPPPRPHGRCQAMNDSDCPGCGLRMPVRERASYDGYYNCSAECWDVYTEVLGAEFGDAVLFGQVHQLTVDAYAAQHAGGRHPDKSVAIHLAGLYLMLERGVRPTAVPPLFQELAAKVSDWPHFPPPEVDWSVTVWDVALAGSSEEHAARSREWAEIVWRGWSERHDEIARFIGAHLKVAALPG